MSNEYAVAPRLQQFSLGDRVVVSGRCAGWRYDASGVICSGPEPVQIVQGEDYWYMVTFDTPQHDLSDDGPYYKAQILGCCIVAETEQTTQERRAHENARAT